MLVEEFPCWRQTQACAMADKQRLTKFFLQGFHLETNGRLGQRQACGGLVKLRSRAISQKLRSWWNSICTKI